MKRHHPSCWKSLVASASGSSTSVSHAFEQNSKRNSKKNLRQRHPGWIFQGMLMPNTAACPAMWHFGGIQPQSRLTSSRCNYKHLKFTGQVLLNVVQRALTNEQVLESNSKISSRELQRPCCSWDCQKPKRRLGLYLPMAAYHFAAMISPMESKQSKAS